MPVHVQIFVGPGEKWLPIGITMVTWAWVLSTDLVFYDFTANENHMITTLTSVETQDDFKEKFSVSRTILPRRLFEGHSLISATHINSELM